MDFKQIEQQLFLAFFSIKTKILKNSIYENNFRANEYFVINLNDLNRN